MKIIPILNGMLVLTSGIGFSIQQVRAQQKPHIILIWPISIVAMLWDVWGIR